MQEIFCFPNLPMEVNDFVQSQLIRETVHMDSAKKRYLKDYTQSAMSTKGDIVKGIGKYLLAIRDHKQAELNAMLHDLAREAQPTNLKDLENDLKEITLGIGKIFEEDKYHALKALYR
jgi:hypothetical protein